MTAVAQQSDNPLAVAASLALIMAVIYVAGIISTRRRRIARTIRRHPAGGPR